MRRVAGQFSTCYNFLIGRAEMHVFLWKYKYFSWRRLSDGSPSFAGFRKVKQTVLQVQASIRSLKWQSVGNPSEAACSIFEFAQTL